jgi:hypothetical protein
MLAVEASLVSCVSIVPWPGQQLSPVPLKHLTVKVATQLQLGPLAAERRSSVLDFVAEFAAPAARRDVPACEPWAERVFAAMRQLWSLQWDNHFKEVYWRLVHNGLPTAARMHQARPCGVCQQQPVLAAAEPLIGRLHHFWECPVAQAVVAAVQRQLPPAWCSEPLTAHHVLCMHPPAGGAGTTLHAGVWRVVCLAAVCAMDVGRRAACRAAAEEAEQQRRQQQQQARQQQRQRADGRQRRITALLQPAALLPHQQRHQQRVQERRRQRQQEEEQQRQRQQAAALEDAQRAAEARFFELLQDFVAVRAAPGAWLLPTGQHSVPSGHPFLRPARDRSGLRCVAVPPPPPPPPPGAG